MEKELTKEDWRNASKALDFWQDEWGYSIAGGDGKGYHEKGISKELCETTGWPSVQIALGRGEIDFDENGDAEFTLINKYQSLIQEYWVKYQSQDLDQYYRLLETEDGRKQLRKFFNDD